MKDFRITKKAHIVLLSPWFICPISCLWDSCNKGSLMDTFRLHWAIESYSYQEWPTSFCSTFSFWKDSCQKSGLIRFWIEIKLLVGWWHIFTVWVQLYTNRIVALNCNVFAGMVHLLKHDGRCLDSVVSLFLLWSWKLSFPFPIFFSWYRIFLAVFSHILAIVRWILQVLATRHPIALCKFWRSGNVFL